MKGLVTAPKKQAGWETAYSHKQSTVKTCNGNRIFYKRLFSHASGACASYDKGLKCMAESSSWLTEFVLIVDQIQAMITTKKAKVIGIL